MSDFWDDDDSFDTSDTGGSSGNDDFFGNNNAGSGQDFFADNNSGGQDFFGNDSSGSDDFFGNNGSNGDDFFAQNSRPNNQQPQPQNESPKPPIKTNFSSKMIGLILIGIVLLVALVLVIFNNIHITKKEEGSTQVVRGALPKQAQLTDLSTGRSYSLQLGKNTLGRKAGTSDASVQIETTDSYMSRNHIGIDLESRNGGIYCVLYNTRNRNKTLVNGNRVEEGDRIELQNGTIITLGNTQLKFTLQ